ncbi:MAG: CfrBI family restriction endonuclease [Chromatiales bacterium]|nr:CfrBI family restriction endonuclease [Chromatiales bacterium]
MTLTEQVIKNIIKKLLKSEDYRIEIISLIDAVFLQFTIEFFKKIIAAKLNNQDITVDWYKKELLDSALPAKELAINSGLNMKTIVNMFNSGKKEIVINAADDHYDTLYNLIESLIDAEDGMELKLTLKFNEVSVELNVSETLVVVNTLAVKRAAIRGGLWSTAGKRVEKPLMLTLCKLYEVSSNNYRMHISNADHRDDFDREVDFYLLRGDAEFKCEVKLIGKGNPESADAVIARGSKVFVADKLSDTNKAQLNSLGVEWVALRDNNGFHRFATVLRKLKIPFTDNNFKDVDSRIEQIFNEIFT